MSDASLTQSARAAVGDMWDDVVARWLDGDTTLSPDLAQWRAGYSGAVDDRWYPDPFVGDLRGEVVEPRLVVLGINPGVGHARLQDRAGIWSERIRATSYSRCLDRVAFDDPAWLEQHGRNSPYWANLMRFARRWTGDAALATAQVLNMELYPWHSDRVAGRLNPAPDILDRFVWQPIAEVAVAEVFAFGAPWLAICEGLGWPLLGRFGPQHDQIPSNPVPGWNLAVFAMPSGQRAVVSWQGGFAGPPSAARLDVLRTVLDNERLRPPPARHQGGNSDPRLAPLIDFGCPAEVLALIAGLPEETTWYAEPAGGQGQFWHVKADRDAEGAVYVDRTGMMIGLPPESAAALARQLGTRLEKRNPTTWRVRVTPKAVADPVHRAAAIQSIAESLGRSATRAGRGATQRSGARERDAQFCPICGIELPANGVCDDHGPHA